MLLLVLGHVDPHHRPLVVEEELGEGPRQLRLSHPGRAEEEERAERTIRVLKSRAGAPDRVRDRANGGVLPHHALSEAFLHRQELLELALEKPLHGNAAPAGHHLGDVLLVDFLLEELQVLLDGRQRGGVGPELLLELGKIPVPDPRDGLQIAGALRLLLLVP